MGTAWILTTVETVAAVEVLVNAWHAGKRKCTKDQVLAETGCVVGVNDLSLSVGTGEIFVIMGLSGSGKSTILNMIGLIDIPTSGEVIIDGKNTKGMSDQELTRFRHEVLGFIFQSFNLIPVLNVWENIEFPLLLGKTRIPKNEWKEWIDFLIDEVGLDDWRNHKPNELSGGQRQRVAIARALVTKPSIVLADEPTANLDSATGEQIIDLMKKINREIETTFIFSTHDAKIVNIADHIIRLRDGTIIENRRNGEDIIEEGAAVVSVEE